MQTEILKQLKYNIPTDQNDRDENNKPKEKWYKLELTPVADILYDNPEYNPDEEPVFQEVQKMIIIWDIAKRMVQNLR